jgi:hypothetical protein
MILRIANTNEDKTGVPSGNKKTNYLLMKLPGKYVRVIIIGLLNSLILNLATFE